MSEVNHEEIPAALVFTPSTWKRSMECVGWGRLAKALKLNGRDAKKTDIADRGTRIHDYAEKILKGEYIKESDPDEWAMAKKFTEFVAAVRKQFAATHTDIVEVIEEQFEIFDGIEGKVDYGTWGKNNDGKWDIVAVDLKTGYIEVAALDNPQILGYLAGIENRLMLQGYDINSYHGFVFQDDVWDKQRYTSDEFDRAYAKARRLVKEAMTVYNDGGDYELQTGSHCRYCPVLAKCPKHKHDIEVVEVLSEFSVIRSLSHVERVELYAKSESIKKFLEANEEALLNELKGGDKIDGVKLIRGRGARFFRDEKLAAATMIAAGQKAYKEPELYGVTYAEKFLKPDAMKKLTDFREGKLKIALASDTAPEVSIGMSAVPEDKTFGAV